MEFPGLQRRDSRPAQRRLYPASLASFGHPLDSPQRALQKDRLIPSSGLSRSMTRDKPAYGEELTDRDRTWPCGGQGGYGSVNPGGSPSPTHVPSATSPQGQVTVTQAHNTACV